MGIYKNMEVYKQVIVRKPEQKLQMKMPVYISTHAGSEERLERLQKSSLAQSWVADRESQLLSPGAVSALVHQPEAGGDFSPTCTVFNKST